MPPIGDHRDHAVRARLQRVQHELGLPPAQMKDSRHAPRYGVSHRRQVVIDEQVMMSRSRSLVRGRDNLHRSEEHTSELQSPCNLVCRLLLEKKKHTIKVTRSDLTTSG